MVVLNKEKSLYPADLEKQLFAGFPTGLSAARPHRSQDHRCAVILSVIHTQINRFIVFFFYLNKFVVLFNLTLQDDCDVNVTGSSKHCHLETRPHSAGSSHTHLIWICMYLAVQYHWILVMTS